MSEQVPYFDFIWDASGKSGFVRSSLPAAIAQSCGYQDPEAARRIDRAVGDSDLLQGLIVLATSELATHLPLSLSLAREFIKCFLVEHLLGLRMGAPGLSPGFPPDGLVGRLLAMAPLPGLTRSSLDSLWLRLVLQLESYIRFDRHRLAKQLFAAYPVWAQIGVVELRLRDAPEWEAVPFLFEATYFNGVSGQEVLRRGALCELFMRSSMGQPRLGMPPELERALACSRIVKQLAVSHALVYPTLLSPGEAYAFLRDVPAISACGVRVVVPDWWACRRPPRMELVARVGTRTPSGFGLGGVLDFQLSYLIDEVELPPGGWARLVAENQDGLVRVGGRWFEVERALIEATARAWKSTEALARDGLPLAHALAAVRSAGSADPGAPRVSYVAGAWLGELLSAQKAGAHADPDLGAELQATLRPYQREGVAWLALMSEICAGVCLADDMGLGKTLQVLALILRLRRRGLGGPHLLVVPASLIGNWCEEIAAHAPTLSTAVVHHAHVETPIERADLVLTSYATLLRQPGLLEREWPLVVLDEAQTIKNPDAKQTIAVKKLRASMRIALTGTPVENHLGELWSIFDFLNKGLLGSAAAFRQQTRALSTDPMQTIDALRTMVRPFILRRMKTDPNVIRDLPEKVEIPVFCGLTSLQAQLYGKVVHDLETSMKETEGLRRERQILAALVHFKQICNHPAHYLGNDDYIPEQSAKFLRLRALCEPIVERGERALVFTQFQEITAPLAAFLATIFRRQGLVLDGKTPVARRTRIVADFQREDGPPFMVLSLKVGGTGLNLTAASHVIHFDRWWNPAAENQASDRAYRIGQSRNVMVELLRIKQTLADDILSESDTPHLANLGPDDAAEASDRDEE